MPKKEPKWETIQTDYGSVYRPAPTCAERIVDIGFKLAAAIIAILLILAIVGYFFYCVPFWFQPFINAPLICVTHGK